MFKTLNRIKTIGLLNLLLVAFVGGAFMPSVIRIGVQGFHPFLFNFLRSFFTLLLMTPILFKYKKYFLEKDIWKLMIALGLGIGGNIFFFSLGINHTTLVASQLLYATVPIFVPIFAFFAIKEKFNKNKLLGILLSLSGLLTLVIFSTSPSERLSLGSFRGNILILLGSIFYSTYLVNSKRFVKKYPAPFMASATYLSLTLFFLFPAIVNIFWGTGFINSSPSSWVAVLGIAPLSAIFVFALQAGIKRISATTASMVNLLTPGFAAITGIIFFKEKLSLILILSLILVLGGVLLSTFNGGDNSKKRNKEIHEQ